MPQLFVDFGDLKFFEYIKANGPDCLVDMKVKDQIIEVTDMETLTLLNSINFNNVTFLDCMFTKATFNQTRFNRCQFKRCRFVGLELVGASLLSVTFKDCNLYKSKFSLCTMISCDVWGCKWTASSIQVLYHGGRICDTDLARSRIIESAFNQTSLLNVDLTTVSTLWDTNGNSREIKTINVTGIYVITYTATHLQVGCEYHPIETWKNLTKEAVCASQGEEAWNWWVDHKDYILGTIERYPALPVES